MYHGCQTSDNQREKESMMAEDSEDIITHMLYVTGMWGVGCGHVTFPIP